ncbi:MAG TPA: hypothetical protein VMY77_02090 [Chitinophagaceae bacterium]|nr:hypothetical protein [Chitinophagaceae bacterium]
MQLVNIMMIPRRKLFVLVLFALPLFSLSQENSPYSRYGIGNLVVPGNILNRGMGGISAGYSDLATINYINPASYGRLFYTTLDIGAQVDTRILKSINPEGKFTTNNAVISYLQVGFPLLNGNKKAIQKKIGWGANLGLRPISKINYKIENNRRISNIDSLVTLYEGSGGINEVFIGTGIQIKNFSIGLNAGYLFGNKSYSTRLIFIPDSANVNYLKSNSATRTNIGGLSFNAGVQYAIELKKNDSLKGVLRIGAYGTLQKKYGASQDILRETWTFNGTSGAPDHLDSISDIKSQKGKVQLPATYGVGFTVEKEHWLYGVDFETSNWDSYRFYGQNDFVKNNWTVKAGFQYYPARINSRKYGQFIKYRAGVSFGPDYIVADKKLPQFSVSLGAGLPLKLRQAYYETQRSVMNVALEYGNRGNKNNNIHENIMHISVGFSLSDIWFRRYKYQ